MTVLTCVLKLLRVLRVPLVAPHRRSPDPRPTFIMLHQDDYDYDSEDPNTTALYYDDDVEGFLTPDNHWKSTFPPPGSTQNYWFILVLGN